MPDQGKALTRFLLEVDHKSDSVLRAVRRRRLLRPESSPQTFPVDRQALSVADEQFSFQRDRLGIEARAD